MLNLIIDKNKIIKNIKKIEQFASKYKFDYKFYVVKSNAYGYGLKEIVKIILEQKCTRFAVARFEEALQIRAISKTAEIMILGMIDDKYINIAIKNKFYIPICNNDQLKRYSLMNVKNLKCELAINTGMNRIGFNNETDLLNAYKCMKENGAEIVGIFSHFFNTSNLEVCKKQANMFNKFVQCIPEWKNIKYRSLRASGGIDNTRYIPKTLVENTCRPGACIFGWESPLHPEYSDVFNSFKLISSIVQINVIKKNEYVGYDGGYKAKNNIEYIAVIPCGYGDGFPRSFSKGGFVYIKNKKYPIIGKIAMDSFMVKVDKTVKSTDIVEIFKDEKHLSSMIGKTMKYDAYFTILANINTIRVKRVITK